MTLMSRLLARMYHLPPAETYAVSVEKNLAAPMPDGVLLRADRYAPRGAVGLPTLLVRTPYGRANLGLIWGQVFAERGFQVVIQSCRGTDDSGGERSPFRGEREDGLATIAWLEAQDWFDGRLGMAGPSYMGFTQWAVAPYAGPALRAISTQVTSSEFRSVMHLGGTFNLEIFLQWVQITHNLTVRPPRSLVAMFNAGRRLKAGANYLSLREADRIAVGEPAAFWRDWLEHGPADDWWSADDYSADVAAVTAPNHMLSGWYDFMLPHLLRDFAVLQQAARQPYLTIGPWSHSSNGLAAAGLRESLLWLKAHLLGETNALRSAPVRIYVMGADEWRDFTVWPPAEAQPQRLHLQPQGALAAALPPASDPSRYRYDPAEPTPNVGGATNATLGRGVGAQDNRALEARLDVLVFSGPDLERDLEVIGPLSAELYVTSSLEHTDFFVRLCDVHPDGKSLNVSDGILRLSPGEPAAGPDGCRKVVIELWPTAHCFKRGHRIRVQVSSGAFPRFARNLGTGEPLMTGTSLRAAEQQVYHDPQHPSAIILPVM